MQQGGEFSSSYYPHHYPPAPAPAPAAPNPIHPSAPASAPPYSPYSSSSEFPAYTAASAAGGEFPAYSAPYGPYHQPPADPAPAPAPYQPYTPPPFQHEPAAPAAPYPHLQQPYYPYDSHQPPTYAPPPAYPSYDAPAPTFDHSASSYLPNYPPNAYPDAGYAYGRTAPPPPQDDAFGEGVYRYDGGGGAEPYGARGTGTGSARSAVSGFDDYGRPKGMSGKEEGGSTATGKIVRAVPKADTQEDVKSGVQKFRVKLLAEGGGGSTTDVLCQIGLDGIRMLDPSTSRTLRIYPLETVTRWEVTDPSIYTFWSKSFVDIEPRRIRLQSNSYTTSTILDTVTAAAVQLKEMGGRESLGKTRVADAGKQPDQSTEKKKGLVDWMNIIKPGNEEKEHWVPDEAVAKCTSCGTDFNAFVRKHHCRNCGDIFCDKCTQGRTALTADENAQPVRVCDRCMAEVSQRLSNAKETVSKSAGLHSHEDLAKKLREEMERNKSSTGAKSSGGSARRMREVACPTCTVHLQVQVPATGSETIECGVCQHPFLVSAH